MINPWEKNNSYISVLAPMEDVTDTVFRQVIVKCYKPDLMFTEFTNCEGICSRGREQVIHRLKFSDIEKPMIAQIWGINPNNYQITAQICCDLGFAGVDINMGCPEKNVTKIGACSALINNQNLAKEIIDKTLEGLEGRLALSIKTRIGYNSIITKEWISFLLQQNIQAITIHARTAKEQSLVANHFDQIAIACKLRNQINPKIKIIANGDIKNAIEGEKYCRELGCDGYMIGRGIFQNPWCFDKNIDLSKMTTQTRLELLFYHIKLWQETWNHSKHYPKLKKYFKIYCQGFEDAQDLRNKLMQTEKIEEVETIISNFLLKII